MADKLNEAARAFLDEKRFAVLATILPDGTPQQTVMWYLIEGNELLFNTKRGRVKDQNLSRDPRVSLCIEDGYRYVTIRGTARMNDDPATAQADIKRLAIRYQGPQQWEQMGARVFSSEDRVSYRVALDDLIVNGFDS